MTLSVSILMSVYARDDAGHLAEALASLSGQTRLAEQVVLVFDGPVQTSIEAVVQDYRDRLPLEVLRLPSNVGLARALNAGLALCRHEWVARFDADDVCMPHRLARQMACLAADPRIDVLGSAIEEFHDDHAAPYAVRAVLKDHVAIVRQARSRNPMNHMTVVFRRSRVLAAGGYPDDRLYEDYALWVKLILAGARFANVEEPLVRARAGPQLASRRGGWRYLSSEIRVHWRFFRSGFIGMGQFLVNALVRGSVRLAPDAVRRWLYANSLRQRIRAGRSSTSPG
jgi:glycosyltransferase involved in cell wall biosynthesis